MATEVVLLRKLGENEVLVCGLASLSLHFVLRLLRKLAMTTGGCGKVQRQASIIPQGGV
jgi:hypothetical protein